jgi:hypothetical protein
MRPILGRFWTGPILDTHQSEAILDTADSGHAPIMDSDSGQAILDTHQSDPNRNRTPIGTADFGRAPIRAPILDTHQSEPDVIQEVIQGSNSE